MLSFKINNINLKLKDTNLTILQACNLLNIQIPIFCFHTNLRIAGNCWMCLVEVKNSIKPIVSCSVPLLMNMEVFTDTPLVQKSWEHILEFLLINHPLDCPICDQGGECDLQDLTLVYNSDKTRFFDIKRSVVDKYCGPYIKTIMNRCIHCTWCVRFVNEICSIDGLGTTGWGSTMEISFYIQKIFDSEFSGNVIDICPVGALTSKPYAFKARPWELTPLQTINMFDSANNFIECSVYNNNIIRVLPSFSFSNIQKYMWINNKIRFFFDSLQIQRLNTPLLKQKDGAFKAITWLQALTIISKKFKQSEGFKTGIVLGDFIGLKALNQLNQLINRLQIINILPQIKFSKFVNLNFCTYFLINSYNFIKTSDLCLLINCNPRTEHSTVNLSLQEQYNKKHFKIASIGPIINVPYKVQNLGLTLDNLLKIIKGQHSFSKQFENALNPIIILGENMLKTDSLELVLLFQTLSLLKKKNNNLKILTQNSNLLNFFNYFSISRIKTSLELVYLLNTTSEIKTLNKSKQFIIYQGHHFTNDAKKSSLILPTLTCFENKDLYLNMFGLTKTTNKIIVLKPIIKSDFSIIKNVFIKFNKLNKIYTITNKSNFNTLLFTPFIKKVLLPHKLGIINKKYKNWMRFNNFYFTKLVDNFYQTNIFELFSYELNKSISNSKKKNFFITN